MLRVPTDLIPLIKVPEPDSETLTPTLSLTHIKGEGAKYTWRCFLSLSFYSKGRVHLGPQQFPP